MHFHIFIAFTYLNPSLPKWKYRYDAAIIISSRQYHRFFFLQKLFGVNVISPTSLMSPNAESSKTGLSDFDPQSNGDNLVLHKI